MCGLQRCSVIPSSLWGDVNWRGDSSYFTNYYVLTDDNPCDHAHLRSRESILSGRLKWPTIWYKSNTYFRHYGFQISTNILNDIFYHHNIFMHIFYMKKININKIYTAGCQRLKMLFSDVKLNGSNLFKCIINTFCVQKANLVDRLEKIGTAC